MLDHSTGFDRRHSIDASAFVLSSRPPSVMTRICEHAVDPSHKPFCPLRGGGDQRPGSRTRPAVVEILCCLKMARDQNAGRSSRARGPNGIPWSDSSLDDDLQSVPVGPPAYSKVIRFLFADSLTAGQVLCNGSFLRLPKPARHSTNRWSRYRNGGRPTRVPAPRPLLQCLPEGETMPNLGRVVQKLRTERDRAQLQVDRLNAALAALDSVGNRSGRSQKSRAAKRRRPMSTAARKRIAAAQRARWAKWKAANRKK